MISSHIHCQGLVKSLESYMQNGYQALFTPRFKIHLRRSDYNRTAETRRRSRGVLDVSCDHLRSDFIGMYHGSYFMFTYRRFQMRPSYGLPTNLIKKL